jgi:PAS domain S-box-containing protein
MDKPSILVVEDEPLVAYDIAFAVRSLGYEVAGIVPTGEKTLLALETSRPDLILMDIQLGGTMDGIETMENIKKLYSIPFIYLSTFSDDHTLSRAKLTEPYGYITKAFNKNDLHSMIEMALYRHRVELKAKENEELLSVTLKSISDMVLVSTLDGTILSWNKGAETLLGFSEEEVKGKNLSIISPSFHPNEMPDILDRLKDGEEVDHYETVRQTKSGAVVNVSEKVSPIRNSLGSLQAVSIIGRDITSRKQFEMELLGAIEEERKRLGQDLHDSLGQHLTGISLKLKALENQFRDRALMAEANSIGGISALVKEAILQTRNLAKGLIPVTLESEGLSVALQEIAAFSESMSGIKVMVRTEIDIELPKYMSNHIYHIVQEALSNAQKHGKADQVIISLYRESSEVCVTVEDNGIGIGTGEIDTKGLGLKIMRFRANLINANLTVYRQEKGGTMVLCRIPILKENG